MVDAAIMANPGVHGFLFDGFPRTKAQAEALDNLLMSHESHIDLMLALDVPDEELMARMLNRSKTSGRTDDADPAIQQKRINVYKNETLAVAEHYRHLDKVVHINGLGSIDDIFAALAAEIDARD
jgi:adenylate kinase